MAADELLTLLETAKLLRMSRRTLYERLKEPGFLPVVRLSPRMVRIRKSAALSFDPSQIRDNDRG